MVSGVLEITRHSPQSSYVYTHPRHSSPPPSSPTIQLRRLLNSLRTVCMAWTCVRQILGDYGAPNGERTNIKICERGICGENIRMTVELHFSVFAMLLCCGIFALELSAYVFLGKWKFDRFCFCWYTTRLYLWTTFIVLCTRWKEKVGKMVLLFPSTRGYHVWFFWIKKNDYCYIFGFNTSQKYWEPIKYERTVVSYSTIFEVWKVSQNATELTVRFKI